MICLYGSSTQHIQGQSSDCDSPSTESTLVSDVTWSPDGDRVAFFTGEGMTIINIVDEETEPLNIPIDMLSNFHLAYSDDGEQLAVTFQCHQNDEFLGLAQVFDAQTGELLHTFEGSPGAHSVEFIQDDTVLVVGGHQVQLWSLEQEEVVTQFGDYEWGVQSMAISSDEHYLVAGNCCEESHLWNLETGEVMAELPHENWSVSFLLDDSRFILGGTGKLTQFSVEEPHQNRLIQTSVDEAVVSFAHHPEYDLIAVLQRDGQLVMLDSEATVFYQTQSYTLEDDNLIPIINIVFSPDGTMLAVPGDDNRVAIYTVANDGMLMLIRELG